MTIATREHFLVSQLLLINSDESLNSLHLSQQKKSVTTFSTVWFLSNSPDFVSLAANVGRVGPLPPDPPILAPVRARARLPPPPPLSCSRPPSVPSRCPGLEFFVGFGLLRLASASPARAPPPPHRSTPSLASCCRTPKWDWGLRSDSTFAAQRRRLRLGSAPLLSRRRRWARARWYDRWFPLMLLRDPDLFSL
jgi:hypothetical protein